MKNRVTRRRVILASLVLVSLLSVIGTLSAQPVATAPARVTAAQVIKVEGDVQGTHDPSIIQDGDTWYLFATTTEPHAAGELPIRCSPDLHEWQRCGYVLPGIPDWIRNASPKTRNLWAPDISYFDGLFHLYYAYSAFGVNTSGIALIANLLAPDRPGEGFNANHRLKVRQNAAHRRNQDDEAGERPQRGGAEAALTRAPDGGGRVPAGCPLRPTLPSACESKSSYR